MTVMNSSKSKQLILLPTHMILLYIFICDVHHFSANH